MNGASETSGLSREVAGGKTDLKPSVFVIGDSISIQYGLYLESLLSGTCRYFRKEGDEALDNLDQPLGANGGDSLMVLNYLRTFSISGGIDADWLLLNCGLHDIKRDAASGQIAVPLETYGNNLHAILGLVAGWKCQLVWIRTTPVEDLVHNTSDFASRYLRHAADLEDYNLEADRIMKESGIPVIDLHRLTLNLGPDLYCDHVHFVEPVCRLQAAFIAGWISARM